MKPHPDTDIESADAEKVDQALAAIAGRDLDSAEPLLISVIERMPGDYSNARVDEDGGLSIKFWDQHQFIHYVTWQQEQGAGQSIRWVGNAYPRAHYYMGFICVKRRQFDRAIQFLDQGQRLEPENPMFKFEKAQALVHSGRGKEALALYDQVDQAGPFVSAHDLAVARRGRGFALIELGRLDEAEDAFGASLEIEPESEVALNELRYIEHLRRGGAPTGAGAVQSATPNLATCAICGRRFKVGVVVSLEGGPVSICKRCEGKLRKKWWQFWK